MTSGFPFRLLAYALAALAVSAQNGAPPVEALVEGAVVNRLTSAPVKRAHVMAVEVTTAADSHTPFYSDTDSGGHYALHLKPGAYRIWVEHPGFAHQRYGAQSPDGVGVAVTVGAAQELRDVSFKLTPYGAIAGHVFEEDGEPVVGAGVQVLRYSYRSGRKQLNPVSGGSTNDRGEYRIFGLRGGRYFLLATQRGTPSFRPPDPQALIPEGDDPFAPVYYPGALDLPGATQLTLPDGGELRDIDIRASRVRAVSLHGRLASPVEDFAGSQLHVVLAPREGPAASYVNRLTATVDKNTGRFEIHPVSPGSYLLVASQLYRGRALGGRVAVEVTAAAQDDIVAPLTVGFDLTGTVEIEDQSAPSGNLHVSLIPTEGLMLGPQPVAAAGPGGTFRLPGVTPGIWDVSIDPLPAGMWIKAIRLGDRDVLTQPLDIPAAPPGPLRIVLAANGGEISGTVATGAQAANATVVLAPAGAEARGSARLFRNVHTDGRGGFVLKSIRPGAYKLFAFEEVEPFAWLDPDFLRTAEAAGEDVNIAEGDHISKQLTPISPPLLQPGR